LCRGGKQTGHRAASNMDLPPVPFTLPSMGLSDCCFTPSSPPAASGLQEHKGNCRVEQIRARTRGPRR